MSGDLLLLECASADLDPLKKEIEKATGANAFVQKVQSAQGVTVYQVIVDVVLPIALAILPMLPDLVRKHRPKRMKIGAFEIENPTPEQAAKMWQDYLDAHKKPHEHQA
jgi:hypothetical protein